MAEWLIEEGIGESRALLMQGDQVLAAKLLWPGEMRAGELFGARLTIKHAGTRRGIATLETGAEVLVDYLPKQATEGLNGSICVTRAPIAERGRLKMAQGRWVDDDALPNVVSPDYQQVRAFTAGNWEEIWHAASTGSISFPGGEILCSVTPAMTVIDIDGDLPPRELALAAIPAISRALRWFDIGGNIGIDFPSIEAKADRRIIDDALDHALTGWRHERTAMNGFGFVQLVARLEGPSLLHRFATSRTGMCARYALRVSERTEGAGITLLTIHPAIKAKLKPDWIEELCRRTGRSVRIETDPGLALEAPNAQVVSE